MDTVNIPDGNALGTPLGAEDTVGLAVGFKEGSPDG